MSFLRILVAGLLVTLASCVWARSASAGDTVDEPGTALGIHFQLPGSGVSSDGGTTLGGISLSLRFARFIEAEAGITAMGDRQGVGNASFIRAGIAPYLVLPRSDNRWSVRVPLLIGYSYLPKEAAMGEGQTTYHAVTAAAGLDTTRWSLGGVGLNVRLLAYVGLENKTMPGLLDRLGPRTMVQGNTGVALSLGFNTRL